MSSDSDPGVSDSVQDHGVPDSNPGPGVPDSDPDPSIPDSDPDPGVPDSDPDPSIPDSDPDPSVSDSDSDVCDHGEIQNRYCETCKQFFCENCDEMHKDHIKKEYAKKELQKFKMSEEEIEKKLDQLKDKIESDKDVEDIHKEMYKNVCCLEAQFKTRRKVQYMEPKGTIRIASWNVNSASDEKRIDCMQKTIRENKFDIVALQEAGAHGKGAKKIHHVLKECDDKWKLSPDKGLPTHLSGVFLWNASSKLKEIKVTIMVDCDGFANKPCLGIFTISDWRFALLNFHLKPRFSSGRSQKKVNDKEISLLWGDAYTKAKRICEHNDVSEENIILLGDFNNIPQNVVEHGYVNTFGFQEYTNTKRDDTYDNIIVHHTLQQYCKNHGVGETVTEGTTLKSE